MGRPKGSKNKRIRKAPRNAYDTYEYWYNKYTKDPAKKLYLEISSLKKNLKKNMKD